jgi:nucleotide-binding universal stress UspA family protein
MKVLMAVDHSQFSACVVEAAIQQFRPEQTEVRVLHVLQPATPPPPQMSPGYAPELEAEKKPAQELVERLAEKLRTAGFKASGVLDVGDVREQIVDYAAEWQADLIMVGSRGRMTVARMLLGSVAEFVARHAKCSVEIVRRAGGQR